MTRARDLSKFANSQAFSVDSDFQVGINSTVPAATLDVRGDSVITGILTATSHDATGLTGTPDITVNNIVAAAATFSGVVTYEDVTNVDSVGVVTARLGVNVSGGEIAVGAAFSVGQAGVVTATSFAGNLSGGTVSGTTGTFTGDVDIADKIVHTGDTNTAIRFPAADTFTVETGGSEALRVNSDQKLLVGSTSSRDNFFDSSHSSNIQVEGNTTTKSSLAVIRNDNGDDGSRIFFAKSRGTGDTIVQDDDRIGAIEFQGNDGGGFVAAAHIASFVDGTPGSNDMPARLVFSTTADGASSPTERVRIDSSGRLMIQNTSAGSLNAGADDLVVGSGSGDQGITIYTGNSDQGSFYFADGTSGAQQYAGGINYGHSDNQLRFLSNGSTNMRLDSSGRLLIGHDSPAENNNRFEVSTTYGGRIGFLRNDTSTSAGNNLGMLSFYGNDSNGTYQESARIQVDADLDHATDDKPGRISFLTSPDGSNTPAERLRIDSRGSFQFSNGFMNETVKINTTARTGTQAVNLDDGMVHYFSTNSSGTWKPNFTMSAGNDINATIATGDVFSPTMIVAKGATTHFANAIQVDGSDVTPEFSGGAPTDGGASGTFDVYNYTIIKTGDDTFKAFASVSTYE